MANKKTHRPVDGEKYEHGLRPVTAENTNVLRDTLYSYF